jgi:hypothetical protein
MIADDAPIGLDHTAEGSPDHPELGTQPGCVVRSFVRNERKSFGTESP